MNEVFESSRSEMVEATDLPAVAERVLVVEDDAATRMGLTELIRTWGFTTDSAEDGEEGLQKITSFRPAIVVTDLVMPRMDGLQLLKALREHDQDISVVILTAQGSVESAVEAIKDGAYDYLTKPVDPQRLRILLAKVVERQETMREVRTLRRQLRDQGSFGRMIGASPGVRKVYRVIEQAAPTGASVLINGESGTGKELVAQTIHELSSRAAGPYVPINCAAIPETLLESELFGHEKGAFTGAVERRQGCFELADRGTIFLDEIAEMTPATQVKLLRVLQERSFRRLGGRQEQKVDVRVIAATNQDPAEAVRKGKLREDLFYRLNVFAITLPPLRERREDIPILVEYFLKRFFRQRGEEPRVLSPAVMQSFMRYPWPGNVRELENACERIAQTCTCDTVRLGCIPISVLFHKYSTDHQPVVETHANPASLSLDDRLREVESNLITWALKVSAGNKSKAAELLTIKRSTLGDRIKKLGLGHLESQDE